MSTPKVKVSQELKDTVAALSHITQVYFAKNGDHFFNKHELKEKGNGTGKFYGRLASEPVVTRVEGERKIYKMEHGAIPELEIVATLSREQILNTETEAEATTAQKLASLQEENEKLKAEAEKSAAIEKEKQAKEAEAKRLQEENEKLKAKLAELQNKK